MKIDFTPSPLDREPAFKTAPRDDDSHRDQGRAFDAAIRDAKPAQKDAPKPDDTSKPDAPSSARSATATDDGSTTPAKAKPSDGQDDGNEADPAESSDPRPLHTLLGILTQTAVAGAADKSTQSDEKALVRTLVPENETKDGQPTAADALSGGKAVRLDVLKMETHFEPHQDGMVLVRSDAEREAKAKAGEGEDLAAAGKAGDTAAVLAGLADKKAAKLAAAGERVTAASAKSAGDAAAADKAAGDEAALPVRFDEALARLSGRDGARSGSDERRGDRRGDADRSAATDASARAADATGSAKAASIDGASALGVGGAGGLGLATQIADRMLEVLGEPAPRPAANASQDSQEHLRMRAGGAALKTLTIQLKPEHLGTLDVSMRLSEGRLTVELAASRADTAVLLSEDRGALRQLLERAGFSVDDASITVVAKDMQPNGIRASDSSASTSGGDNSGSGSPSGQAARDESSAREGDRGDRRPQEQAGSRAQREEAPSRRRSSTYL
ncbi:flagellar hook-length control protein FliK [Aureimonas sp. AU40]|uniref:flagellar hook-length control protein FliK n=1 Tax=Aureimonas sp. AU40 TaxID=1637747 RepID=UPI000785B740|nr:flagellar hook-length control protein FliK [Aureimonas sp. AU40]